MTISKEEITLIRKFLRQEAVLWPPKDLKMPFFIIGVGAVGSITAYALASLGCNDIAVYDPDKVEIHNTAYSFYPEKFVKKTKVLALQKILKYFKGKNFNLKIFDQKFLDQPLAKDSIVIILVDDMDTRIDIWQKRIKNNPDVLLFLEGRMTFETYRLYTVRPCDKDDIEFYESRLYPQKEAYSETCGQRSIIYTPIGLTSEIICNIKKFIKNEPVFKEIIREYYGGTIITNEEMKRENKS